MTTPVPLASEGLPLVQGLVRSGNRIVAVIFTTESRIFASVASSSAAAAPAGAGRIQVEIETRAEAMTAAASRRTDIIRVILHRGTRS